MDESIRAGVSARFWPKVDASGGKDACWPWLASTTSWGYGQIWVGETNLGAHRVAWSLAHGCSVPAGGHVLHHCDNPPCVNPAHLFLGTDVDNIRDRDSKGRAWYQSPEGVQKWREAYSKRCT
jgi:hypothetical protein